MIIASGESQVDAVTAAGLAGNLNAPVLLTRSNQLPHNVARFIAEQNVTDVVVVGGTAAVPDAIVTAIESLDSRPSVERVSGADRYATAAAIGDRLGGPNPTWCNSTQPAAILVNGSDAGRADAIAIGPLAFSLGLPILLTAADEVPESTEAFLADNKVERVVIIGGVSAVSKDVVTTLVEDIGVVTTRRIDGGSAVATSVMIAKEMLGNCASVLQTNKDMVALVNRDATADGIAAAPVLGRGLGGDGPVPILLVDDELPAAVSDYLASTAESRVGHGKTHQGILAIGGTAVVSNSVMADAVAAAKTSSALTAEIKPVTYTTATLTATRTSAATATTDDDSACSSSAVPASAGAGSYSCQFEVTFSDDVKIPAGVGAADTHRTVADPTMYRINGRRLEASAAGAAPADEPTSVLDLVFAADRTVTITLSHHLKAGDTITVDNSLNEARGGRLGANRDLRKLEPASLTLPAVSLPRDTAPPVVEIVAVPGLGYFDVIVTEPNLAINELGVVNSAGTLTETGSLISRYVDFTERLLPADETIAPTTGANGNAPGAANTPRVIAITGIAGSQPTSMSGTTRMRFTIGVTNPNAANGVLPDTGTTRDQVPSPDNKLRAGDVITIKGNAFIDRSNQRSRAVQYRVPQVKTNTPGNHGTGDLEVQRVSIGDYVHTENASAVFPDTTSLNSLEITAKPAGVAAGAAGNSWVIYGYDDRTDGATSSYTFDIDVNVDTANQRISYTITDAVPRVPLVGSPNPDGPTLGDLATALVSNNDFNANFAVDYGLDSGQTKATALGATVPTGVHFGDDNTNEMVGRTSVGVVVKFNAHISGLINDDTSGSAFADGTTNDAALAFDIAPRFTTGLTEGAPATDLNPDAYDVTFQAPDDEVHISYTANSMAELPTRAGFRVIASGVAVGYADDTLRRGYGYTAVDRTVLVANDPVGVHPAVTAPRRNVRELLLNLVPDSRIKP